MPSRLIWLSLAGAALNAWLACALFLPGAWMGRNDFLSFYSGARLAGTARLYDAPAARRIQADAIGESFPAVGYTRLPYFALLLKPLAALPYRAAYAVWLCCSAAAFIGFALLWPAGARKWPLLCWSLPAWVALFNGQDVGFLLLFVAAAAALSRRGRDFAAGAALALCAAKFHLFLLLPVVVVAQRRWNMLAGTATGGAVLAALSFAAAGPAWPRQYLADLADPTLDAGLTHMPGLRAFYGGIPGAGYIQAAILLALAALVWLIARRHKSFEQPLAIALAAGISGAFHAYLADCALLLPAILTLWPRGRAVALATPVPWFLLQMPPLFAALPRLLIAAVVVQRPRTSNSTGRATAFTAGS